LQLKDMKHGAGLRRFSSAVDRRPSAPTPTSIRAKHIRTQAKFASVRDRDKSSSSPTSPLPPSVPEENEEMSAVPDSVHFTFSPGALAAMKQKPETSAAEDNQNM